MAGIEKVAVIGAGVMGAGIAAHVANAGVPVLLLDIVPEGARDRSTIAKGALAALQKARPAAFMQDSAARRVTPGNIEDDLDALAECDWIIEAVTERLDVKHAIYARLAAHKNGEPPLGDERDAISHTRRQGRHPPEKVGAALEWHIVVGTVLEIGALALSNDLIRQRGVKAEKAHHRVTVHGIDVDCLLGRIGRQKSGQGLVNGDL